MEELSDFFGLISKQKKIIEEQTEQSLSQRISKLRSVREEIEFDVNLDWDIPVVQTSDEILTDEYSESKKEINEEVFIQETITSIEPETNNSDPLTPLNQNFVTLEELQNHYKLFLNRIQQQLSTLGGGGETNLAWMDVPTTIVTSNSYSIKPSDYYIGVNYSGAVSLTLPLNMKEGKMFVVKDELGEASRGTNRYITVLPSGNDTIDGQDRVILAYDYGSLTFVYRNNIWRVI